VPVSRNGRGAGVTERVTREKDIATRSAREGARTRGGADPHDARERADDA